MSIFADMDEDRLDWRELGDEAEDGRPGIGSFAGDHAPERLTIANLLSATIDAFDRDRYSWSMPARQVLMSDPLNAA